MLTVSRQRPSWSLAWATWRSRWVSTPTVTRGRSWCAIVVIAVSLLSAIGWRRHAPAGRADSTATGLAPQARIRSRSPGWWHRWRPQRESTGLARGHQASGTTGQTLATTTTATSLQWNKIDPPLFPHIPLTWRARPLTSHEVVVGTSGATTTRTGLTVHSELDPGAYPTGVTIPDQVMVALPLTAH